MHKNDMTQRRFMAPTSAGPSRAEMTAMRANKARRWARQLFLFMVLVAMVGIWQDRNLAPPVHDFMQNTAQSTLAYIENSETLKPHWDKLSVFVTELISSGDVGEAAAAAAPEDT